jgi:cardiolipin synthase
MLNLANKITIGRIILIPFFIAAIIYSRADIALAFFFLAIASDAVDGYIARTKRQKTQLGTFLDPLADKMLLVSAFICLTVFRSTPQDLRFPPYVLIVVISRDVLIVLGTIVIYMLTGRIDIRPTISGKATTFFQMLTIISVLVQFRYSHIIWNMAVVMTVVSGIDYLIMGSRLMNGNHSKKG